MAENKSEELVEKLSKKSFLSLWSTPNPFRKDRKGNKEVCDLLVVCGTNIIIFSVKDKSWHSSKGIEGAWSKWYDESILDSIKQLDGAVRRIRMEEGIFLDKKCTVPLEVEMPKIDECRFYTIAVALNAGKACKDYFNSKRGSLILKNLETADRKSKSAAPFVIPQFRGGNFIHVFDDSNLEILMKNLDTISDFTEYLRKKEDLFFSCKIASASEEDLLAVYLNYNRSFPNPNENHMVTVPEGCYDKFIASSTYKEYVLQNQNSYKLWDGLIETFTNDIRTGEGQREASAINLPISERIINYERGLRQMVLLNRYERRMASYHVIDARNEIDNDESNSMLSRLFVLEKKITEPFLFFIYRPEGNLGVDEVKMNFTSMMDLYCQHNLEKCRGFKSICAVGIFAKSKWTDTHGFMEILAFVQQRKWDKGELNHLNKMRDLCGISMNSKMSRVTSEEFPAPKRKRKLPPPQRGLNRRDRQRIALDLRKNKLRGKFSL